MVKVLGEIWRKLHNITSWQRIMVMHRGARDIRAAQAGLEVGE
jgi:hypothetical protein